MIDAAGVVVRGIEAPLQARIEELQARIAELEQSWLHDAHVAEQQSRIAELSGLLREALVRLDVTSHDYEWLADDDAWADATDHKEARTLEPKTP